MNAIEMHLKRGIDVRKGGKRHYSMPVVQLPLKSMQRISCILLHCVSVKFQINTNLQSDIS